VTPASSSAEILRNVSDFAGHQRPSDAHCRWEWRANVDEATYVIFAAKAARAGVRERLRTGGDDTLRWTERKSFGGSEFFISGPPARAREAHEAMMLWLVKAQFLPH
jgi:hypothetical protein